MDLALNNLQTTNQHLKSNMADLRWISPINNLISDKWMTKYPLPIINHHAKFQSSYPTIYFQCY